MIGAYSFLSIPFSWLVLGHGLTAMPFPFTLGRVQALDACGRIHGSLVFRYRRARSGWKLRASRSNRVTSCGDGAAKPSIRIVVCRIGRSIACPFRRRLIVSLVSDSWPCSLFGSLDIPADQCLDIALLVVHCFEFADNVGVVFLVQFEMILPRSPFVVGVRCFGVSGAHFYLPKYPIRIVKAIMQSAIIVSSILLVLSVLSE